MLKAWPTPEAGVPPCLYTHTQYSGAAKGEVHKNPDLSECADCRVHAHLSLRADASLLLGDDVWQGRFISSFHQTRSVHMPRWHMIHAVLPPPSGGPPFALLGLLTK